MADEDMSGGCAALGAGGCCLLTALALPFMAVAGLLRAEYGGCTVGLFSLPGAFLRWLVRRCR